MVTQLQIESSDQLTETPQMICSSSERAGEGPVSTCRPATCLYGRAAHLVIHGLVITGHLTGSARISEKAMCFAQTNGLYPMIERMPLERANEAIDRLSAGEASFWIVLDATGER